MSDNKTINKLPEFLQTNKLRNFFDGTVEQLFSKPESEKTTEWIGRKYGVNYVTSKDNYKPESSKARQNYQLEPAAIIRDPDNLLTVDATFYDEALNFIQTENGKVNNQNRLFDQKYYTFNAPIDYDKFINYENYYWYPSLDLSVPSITITGTVESFTAKAAQSLFELTYPIGATDVVQYNGSPTTDFTTTGLQLDFSSGSITMAAGDVVTVSHRITPTNIVGLKTYTSPNNVVFSSGMLINFSDSFLTESAYKDKKYFIEGVGSEAGIEFVETSDETEIFLDTRFLEWDSADTPGVTSTVNGFDAERWDTVPSIANPDYITCHRGCRDKNPWSRTNGWVHKDVITNYRTITEEVEKFHPFDTVTDDVRGWDDYYFDSINIFQESAFELDTNRKGAKPILEFNKDIELYKYGKEHSATVDVLATTDTKDTVEGNAQYVIDGITLLNGQRILFVNPNFQTSFVNWDGTDPWDHDSDQDITTGGPTGGDIGWDITGVDFDVSSSIWQVSGVGTSISLTKVSGITIKDESKVTVKLGSVNAGKEFYWTGYEWAQSQQKSSINSPPLFNLYDTKGKTLDDTVEYSSSTFAGNKIFGYKVGSGTNDSDLGFPLSYSNYTSVSEINFENYLQSETQGPTGFKYFKQYGYKNIIQETITLDVTVNPSSGNKFYIDNTKQQTIILKRGNKYIFDLNDSSLVTTGYSGGYHPFLLSTTENGTHASGSAYSTNVKYFHDGVEVTEAVFKSDKYNTASKRKIEFTPDANTPGTLYYYCHVHSGMGGKVVIENHHAATVDEATTINYYNEWMPVSDKSSQRLVQEFEVTDTSFKNNFDLESIVASDSLVDVTVNNVEKKLTTDFTITQGQFIKFNSDLAVNDYIVVKYVSNNIDKNYTRAYYEAPKNLSNNGLNLDVATYDYGDLLDHCSSCIKHQKDLVGIALGNNSYRDTKKDLTKAETILQHDAPMMKLLSHINSDDVDIIKATRFAHDDYVRFKNKFLTKVLEIDRNNDISTWTDAKLVDTIMVELNRNKRLVDNWAYSLMMTYGDTKTTSNVTITKSNKTWSTSSQSSYIQSYQDILTLVGEPGLDISDTFNPTSEKDTKSLYVYKNNSLMLMNQDYVIDNSSGTRIVFIGDTKPDIADVITIDYFGEKQPSWIPATPSKLGMTQIYIPQEITDPGYSVGSKTFIQGHDGSLVLKYGDARDRALLELEKRIYNDAENRFIDPDYVAPLSYMDTVSNYFNKKDYAYQEYNEVIRSHTYRWAVFNGVEWRDNTTYNSADWKTWNWSSVKDISGDDAPGHWRGIYKKFYGTHKPHTHPWEMLGFSQKPQWWDGTYSWKYTAQRAKLINDIEKGIIRSGSRANFNDKSYTDKNNIYRHDGFSNYVPVDSNELLRSPKDIGLVTQDPLPAEAKKSWKIGDIAPAELSFYINSSYSFALVSALYIMKPAQFSELMFDTLNVDYSIVAKEQRYNKNSGKRANNEVYVHRENDSLSNVIVGYGYQHYVSERLLLTNKNVKEIYGGRIRNVQPQLAHKQGSYIDFGSYKVQAESYSPTSSRTSIFIPNNNVNTFLHSSTATQSTSYSAVIVEKSTNGYRVFGYDIAKGFFRTTVSDPNGVSVPIQVGGVDMNVGNYIPNQTLNIGNYIRYEGTIYKVIKSHVTTGTFVASNFQTVGGVPMIGGASATYYQTVIKDETRDYEYGHEFENIQQVFDFMINYGRYLESQGWKFDVVNNQIGETYNWLYGAKEFLFWSLGGWATNNIIAISPAASQIVFEPLSGVVSNVEDVVGSTYAILDKSGNAIDPKTTTVTRQDRQVTITQDDNVPIYFVNLYARELEHITVFDNKTSFDDVLYDPTLAIRQARLKQSVLRSTDWKGKLEANGHIITTDGLISNFDSSAKDIQNYLDVDKTISNEELNNAGLHTIGYQNRSHLENLEIVDENQVKFYQGFVRQKGTKNSIDRLLRTDVISERQDINLYEYYAVKVAEFGGTAINQSIEVKLSNEEIKTDPQIINFLPTVNNTVTEDIKTDNIITIDIDDTTRWVKKPTGDIQRTVLWPTRTEKFEMPTAGYVHLNDTDYQVYSNTDLSNHYANNYASTNITAGKTYWVANDINNDWNVFRSRQIAQGIEGITSNSPLTVSMKETTKLLTANASTIELVMPDHKNSGSSTITSTTYGSKLFELSLTDQSIVKTINFSDFGGSNAEVIVANIASSIQEFVVTTAGTRYMIDDEVSVSGAGGSSGVGKVASINNVTHSITNVTQANPGVATSTGHTFENGDIVTITSVSGMTQLNNNSYEVANKTADTFELKGTDTTGFTAYASGGTATSDKGGIAGINLTSGGSGFFAEPSDITINRSGVTSPGSGAVIRLKGNNPSFQINATITNASTPYKLGETVSQTQVRQGTITNITQAVEGVVTINGHPFNNGDLVTITGVAGMTQLNNNTYTVKDKTANTFKLDGINTTGFTAYTSSGTATRTITATGKVENVYTDGTSTIIHVSKPSPVIAFTTSSADVITGLTSGATTSAIQSVTARSSAAFGDSTFGAILSFNINNGGKNYVNPQLTVSGVAGVASGIVSATSGVVDKAYVTDGGFGYRKQFAEGATIQITVSDTITDSDNKFVDFSDKLLKCDTLSNVAITVNESFDGTSPMFDIGTTSTPNSILSNQSLSANATATSFGTNITDRSNVTVRLRFSGTKVTTGNATITVNYKKAQYLVKELDGTSNVAITSFDTGYFDGTNTHPLWVYDDIRLATRNNGIDQSDKKGNLSATVNHFVSNVCANITFVEGDKIFLDNGGDDYWYTMVMTANSTIKTSYDNLASNASVSPSITIGSNYWIIHSDVDYDQVDANVFTSTMRRKNVQVDSNLFDQSRIYNDYDGKNEIDIATWDPVKRIFPANADKELSYIRNNDPAIYTNHSDTNRITTTSPWGAEQLGRVWWDISTSKYIEYENFDLEYRLTNWGKLFPGSVITICEWISSTQTPANYTGTGTVFSTTNYVTETIKDRQGFTTTTYYYWVKNKTTIPSKSWRYMSCLDISRLIKDPTSQNVSWFAPAGSNSVVISNVAKFISTDNSVMRLNYRTKDKDQVSHKQWTLIKEKDPDTKVDRRIWNKFTDSITGKDALGNSVPDTVNLHENMRYGNDIRPRQSWFKNIKEARRVFAYELNRILKNINLEVDFPNWDKNITTSTYWQKDDFYLPGYDKTIIINKIADSFNDIDQSTLTKNDVVKVNIDNNSKWAIYIYGNRDEILSGNAAISTSDSATTSGAASTSYSYSNSYSSQSVGTQSTGSGGSGSTDDPANYELVRIANKESTASLKSNFATTDDDVSVEIRQWMSTLYDNVFAGSNKVYLNNTLFALFNYIFTEQTNIDWLIQTSYFDAVQEDSSLTQRTAYGPDTLGYVEEYIKEAKPYHGKLISYLSKKSPTTEEANVEAKEFSINVKTNLVFDRISKNIELLSDTSKTDAEQLAELKKKSQLTFSPDNSAIERVAKYEMDAPSLTTLDLTNEFAVANFMKDLRNKIAPFRDRELNSTAFTLDKDYTGLERDKLGLDLDGFDTSNVSWDEDITQEWYKNLFQSQNSWSAGTSYTTNITTTATGSITSNSYVRQTDTSHFTAWATSSTYAVGDIVLHNGQVYKCNVAHKNLATETTLQNSRWDLITDYVYYTTQDHTAGSTFKDDYDSGKWELVTVNFDGAGFIRPQHEDNPEEYMNAKMKETLGITVITFQEVDTDVDDIDSDGNTTEQHGYGDQYTFKIFYGNDGKAQYKRLPKAFETTVNMTGGIDSNTKEITVASGSILWNSVNVPNPDDSSKTIGTVAPVSAGAISDANPGYIWVGPELIEYRKIDGNVLSNLRRGVLGTPIIDHANSAVVRSASTQHDIPNASKSASWSAIDSGGTKLISKKPEAGFDEETNNTISTTTLTYSSGTYKYTINGDHSATTTVEVYMIKGSGLTERPVPLSVERFTADSTKIEVYLEDGTAAGSDSGATESSATADVENVISNGEQFIVKVIQHTTGSNWDHDEMGWDDAVLDSVEQAVFIRAGGISNFNLYNTTYVTPGYATPQSGTTGYFSEE